MSVLDTQSGRDNLIAGGFPIVTESGNLITGQNLNRGALLGQITASKKWTLSLSASSDGSQTPKAILAKDMDASAADKVIPIYVSGEFNQNELSYGTGHTAASVQPGLKQYSIFLKDTVQS